MRRIHNGILIPNKTRNKSTNIYKTYCLLLKLVYYFSATPSHCLLLHVHCCPRVHRLLFGIDLPCAPTNETSLLLEWVSPSAQCVFQPYKSRFLEMVPMR